MTSHVLQTPEWIQTERYFRDYLVAIGKSPTTVATYSSNARVFASWCIDAGIRPEEADKRQLRSWSGYRQRTVSPNRHHNDLAALRHFFAWLVDDGVRSDNPTEGMRVKRTKALPTKPLSRDEISALLHACTLDRDRVMVLLLVSTGMRISELAALRAEDIDWQDGSIKIHGKGDKERRVSPNPDVIGQLHAFAGMFPEGAIFLSRHQQQPLVAHQMRKIIYTAADKAKVSGVHPHRLRATFATEFVQAFGDVQSLQGVLGHNSIETTARYSEFTKNARGIRHTQSLTFA